MRLLLILCLFPGMVTAQSSWNILAEGGVLLNSKTSHPGYFEHGSSIGGIGAGGISYQNRHLEFGITGGYRGYSFREIGDSPDGFDPLTGLSTGSIHVSSRSPWHAVAIAPFFKYHFGSGRFDYYAGLMPAYLNFGRATSTDSLTGQKVKYGNTAQGFALDALAGAAYRITPAIQFFSEVTGGAVNSTWFAARAWFAATSASLGLRITVHSAKNRLAE